MLGCKDDRRRGWIRFSPVFFWVADGRYPSIGLRSGLGDKVGSVRRWTFSKVQPLASSTKTSPFGVTSITASSVMIRFTTPFAGQGKRAAFENLGPASLVVCSMAMINAIGARHQIHRSAHAFHHFAGNHPIREIPLLIHFHGAKNGKVDVPAANHGKGVGAGEVRCAWRFRDGLLAGIDQVGVLLTLLRIWPHAQHSVFRLQHHVHARRHTIRHQSRHADSQVHVISRP